MFPLYPWVHRCWAILSQSIKCILGKLIIGLNNLWIYRYCKFNYPKPLVWCIWMPQQKICRAWILWILCWSFFLYFSFCLIKVSLGCFLGVYQARERRCENAIPVREHESRSSTGYFTGTGSGPRPSNNRNEFNPFRSFFENITLGIIGHKWCNWKIDSLGMVSRCCHAEITARREAGGWRSVLPGPFLPKILLCRMFSKKTIWLAVVWNIPDQTCACLDEFAWANFWLYERIFSHGCSKMGLPLDSEPASSAHASPEVDTVKT